MNVTLEKLEKEAFSLTAEWISSLIIVDNQKIMVPKLEMKSPIGFQMLFSVQRSWK